MLNDYAFKYGKAYKLIGGAKKILLLTHFNPDGDGLSSLCATIELLENLNKDYFAYCYNEPPASFAFLPHLEKIYFHKRKTNSHNGNSLADEKFDLRPYDLIIVLDCGSLSRTKLAEEISQREKNQLVIEFDHHPKVDDYSNLEIRDDQAAATTEIIYRFLKANKIKINKHLATAILVGIITDTANFLYPSTSEQTIKIAAEMLARGARMPRIIENTLKNKSLSSLKVWGKIMSSLKINSDYNLAIAVLTLADLKNYEASEEELEGISNFLGNLYGVNAILLLREEEGGVVRGNLRTAKEAVDVSKLAKYLGGGGHAKSSGFTLEGRLEKTERGWRVV